MKTRKTLPRKVSSYTLTFMAARLGVRMDRTLSSSVSSGRRGNGGGPNGSSPSSSPSSPAFMATSLALSSSSSSSDQPASAAAAGAANVAELSTASPSVSISTDDVGAALLLLLAAPVSCCFFSSCHCFTRSRRFRISSSSVACSAAFNLSFSASVAPDDDDIMMARDGGCKATTYGVVARLCSLPRAACPKKNRIVGFSGGWVEKNQMCVYVVVRDEKTKKRCRDEEKQTHPFLYTS